MFCRYIFRENFFSVASVVSLSTFVASPSCDGAVARADAEVDETATLKSIKIQQNAVKTDLSQLTPISPIRIFRPNPNLEIAFDVRTRNPLYVMERLTFDDCTSNNRKRHHFYEEQTLPEAFRSRNSCYHNSGYDRGHLAPAADFEDQKERLDTYNLVNVSPQNHELNRKTWAQLESWVRQVARSHADFGTTYVVTGPLWLPDRQVQEQVFAFEYAAIGHPPNLVSVPTHFFKLIVVLRENAIVRFACFVVSNRSEAAVKQDFGEFLVRWSDLERATGLQFFPGLATEEWKQLADLLVVLPARTLQNPQLDASSLSSSLSRSTWQRNKKQEAIIAHLCPGGSCRKPLG